MSGSNPCYERWSVCATHHISHNPKFRNACSFVVAPDCGGFIAWYRTRSLNVIHFNFCL
jgi:hypothetical protein